MRLAALVMLLLSLPLAAAAEPGEFVNTFRAQQGLPALRYSPTLEAVARDHATDMAQRGFFSHRGSDGSRLAQRAKRRGYNYCRVAENIARGHQARAAVMQGWFNSPGHRRNILLPDVREYAVVRAPGDVWVMVLGRRGC